MKKCMLITLVALALVSLTACTQTPTAKTGLLIIAHGAPAKQWNETAMQVESQVREKLEPAGPIAGVKLAFMEFAKPSIADRIREFEAEGFSRLMVAPLLVAPSGHSERDIPVMLGLYYDRGVIEELAKEGAEVIRTDLPLTLLPTLTDGNVPAEIMLKRVLELSADPANEAVLILAHGGPQYPAHWDKALASIERHIRKNTKIEAVGHAYIGVGHGLRRDWLKAVKPAVLRKKRLLVVGLYVAMGAKLVPRFAPNAFSEARKNAEVVLSADGFLPDPAVAEWIADLATQAAQ